MKITNKTSSKWVELCKTRIGDVVFFEDTDCWGEEPFIRVDEPSEVQCCECAREGCYVLSLESFDVWRPNDNEKVRVVNAELIITNKGA